MRATQAKPSGMRSDPIASGVVDGIEWVTMPAPLWGAVNGYVRIPEGHPWHGLDYDAIDVDVNGGLTYSRGDWIGFDTLHYGDNWPDAPLHDEDGIDWTPEKVAAETQRLARQVAEAAVRA